MLSFMSYSLSSVICHWLYLAMFRPQIAFVSQIRSERWSVRTAICKWAHWIFGSRQHKPNHLGCCGNDVGHSRYVVFPWARFPHAVKLQTGQLFPHVSTDCCSAICNMNSAQPLALMHFCDSGLDIVIRSRAASGMKNASKCSMSSHNI